MLSSSLANATRYQLTIDNCGVKETFNHAPLRVVTIGQHETELMLGLEKNIAGTSVWFGALPDDLRQQGKNPPERRSVGCRQ